MEWMILPFKRYAEFSGRSRRLEFWMFSVMNIIAVAIWTSLLFTVGMAVGAPGAGANPMAFFTVFGGYFLVLLIWFVIVIVPSAAVTVRRLHDRDMSGWWYLGYLVASFIPLLNFIAMIAFLVIMFLDGTPGPNRYGPDPKGRGVVDVFS